MIGPADISRWAEACFDDYLRSLLSHERFFPLRRDRLGRVPAAHDLSEFHADVKALWEGSKNVIGYGYTVVLEEKNRRIRGVQNEPVAVMFESENDYVDFLGLQDAVTGFVADADFILGRVPGARAALTRSPRLVLDEHGHWSEILIVVEYLCQHPRPGCFVRALPVSVHTKFIEDHQTAIASLLAVLPEAQYNAEGWSFASRCGLLEDEPALRGRFLCPDLQRQCGFPCSDISLPVREWAKLPVPSYARIVACENKVNFLALPAIANTLALFSGGGAATGHLAKLHWLKSTRFIYWGDLDPCGLYILALVRASIPTARSLMMDTPTLREHAEHLVPANLPPGRIDLSRLSPSEQEAAVTLTDRKLGIEQERLLFQECVDKLLSVIT